MGQDYFTIPMLDYRFVEFLRIDTVEDMDVVASIMIDANAEHSSFNTVFGVNLKDFKGFFMEVGYSDAPRGASSPMLISPILALRRSRSGSVFKPNILKVDGYCSHDGRHAWIEASTWEREIGDDLAKTLKEKMDEAEQKFRARIKQANEEGKELTVEDLAGLVMDPGIKRQ